MKCSSSSAASAAVNGTTSTDVLLQTQTSPCAACKLLRRRCASDCLFAPYFPAHQPHKFASVHRVFGASNVNKLLQQLCEEERADAVSSMVYESEARIRDPVYGCVGTISCLQQQVLHLQTQLAVAQAHTVYLQMQHAALSSSSLPSPSLSSPHDHAGALARTAQEFSTPLPSSSASHDS